MHIFFVSAVFGIILPSCQKNADDVPVSLDRTYIIISDLHLCDQRSIDLGFGWTLSMKDTLNAFLDYLNTRQDWDELVIDGDLFDEWMTPPDMPSFADSKGNILSEREYLQNIIAANTDVIDRLKALRKSGHKLVYIPGNHDMQATEQDFEACLPGLFDLAFGAKGLGQYTPDRNIFIEHGHRYDIFSAPYLGKDGIDDIPEGSMLPPSFFMTKLQCSIPVSAMTKAIEDDAYNIAWDGVALLYSKDSVVTEIGEMTKKYGFPDYAYSNCKLFDGISRMDDHEHGWKKRCQYNEAYFVPDIYSSILQSIDVNSSDILGVRLVETQSLPAHIVVWGHMHIPSLTNSSKTEKQGIYLNVGTWVDGEHSLQNDFTSTFGEIKCKDGHYNVKLCRYFKGASGGHTVKTLKEASL